MDALARRSARRMTTAALLPEHLDAGHPVSSSRMPAATASALPPRARHHALQPLPGIDP